MSYAIRKDGKGWRAVNSPADIAEDETFSKIQPDPIIDLAADARAMRAPLLIVADLAINKAEDNGQDVSAWRQYRQALRDITKPDDFPNKVVWPMLPQ